MIRIKNLLSIDKYSRPGRKLAEHLGLIFHYTSIRNQRAHAVYRYFEQDCPRTKHYSSAHYCIDIDGQIYQYVPDDEVAYHCGTENIDPGSQKIYTDWARSFFPKYTMNPALTSPNLATIGIEMCFTGANGEFTDATLEAAEELGTSLCREHQIPPENIGTHHMVVGWKECPLYWTKRPDEFHKFKARIIERLQSQVQ
jgi:N-acetylmuramoyl-L-alanine amidase